MKRRFGRTILLVFSAAALASPSAAMSPPLAGRYLHAPDVRSWESDSKRRDQCRDTRSARRSGGERPNRALLDFLTWLAW